MDEHRQRESLSFEKASKKKQRSRYLAWSIDNPLLVITSIVLMMLAVIFIVGSNFESRSSQIEKTEIGTIASHDYKAPRDFTFDRIDQEATEKIREQRVAEVLPIFKWDSNYQDATLSKFRSAFEFMRNGMDSERMRLEDSHVQKDTKTLIASENAQHQAWANALLAPFKDESVFENYISTRKLTDEEIASALVAWCSTQRQAFEQKLGYDMPDDLFAWLVSESFSYDLEEALIQIFDVTLGRITVSNRIEIDELDAFVMQWFDAGEKRQKRIDKSEKASILSRQSSETLTQTLLREKFPHAPESFVSYFKQFVRTNLEYDETATQRERQNVSEKTAELRVIEEFKKGQTIVARGNPIRQVHYEIFEKLAQSQSDYDNRTGHWGALGIIAVLISFLCHRSIKASTGRRKKNRDVMFLATNILLFSIFLKLFTVICGALDSVYHWPYSMLLLFPFASSPMVMRIVVNRYYAYLFSVCSIILTGLIIEDLSIILPYGIISTMAGCLLMERPKRSNILMQRGIMIGCVSALAALALYIFRGANLTQLDYAITALLGFASGMLSTGVVTMGLPLSESTFGYVTSNKLLELSNLEHPALKTLFLEAPGTYQHSIMVGSLNEAAAEAIGANAILARVGGYYHDIGKVKNAQYFAENQRGDNPHNRIKPNMSALILKAHERDGLDIAKKYHLPQDIMEFIATHHGTSRIEVFYQRAKENAKDQQDRVHEEDYRYPGPKPQTRETGICMVSDMVEAAVRSLPDKSPDKILVLVRKLINHKFTEGQFDECNLTLKDLNDIANAHLSILNAFYHHRPEYPDQKKEREKLEAKKREKLEAEKNAQNAKQPQTDKRSEDEKNTRELSLSKVMTALQSDSPDIKEKQTKDSKEKTDNIKDKSNNNPKDKSDPKEKTDNIKDKSNNNPKDKSDSKEKPDNIKDKSNENDKDKSTNNKPDNSNPDSNKDKSDKTKSKSNKKSDKSPDTDDEPRRSLNSLTLATQLETEEVNVLLKESEEAETASEAAVKSDKKDAIPAEAQDLPQLHTDSYDLAFSSKVDVFKKS
ncbi:MAG: HDIG domain-containing protein [Proteobacteria bacterium]|nr:HDIG domain-containing protein [Pseudomonadota bacterium]